MSRVAIRLHDGAGPVVIYLPGLHGDWSLIGAFRRELGPKVRFVEFSYPKEELSLEVLAGQIHEELSANGVASGWLLGQSFGSQLAWELLGRGFKADGVILAGGFVRHPWPWGARLFRAVLTALPASVLAPAYRFYATASAAFARRGPEEAEELHAFARSRSDRNWKASSWRLELIAGADPRPTARATRVPVHYLGGLIDPLVPWPLVTRWLARECPGYKGRIILRYSDHNVLGSSPRESADRVLSWVTTTS